MCWRQQLGWLVCGQRLGRPIAVAAICCRLQQARGLTRRNTATVCCRVRVCPRFYRAGRTVPLFARTAAPVATSR
jgi:uncharacterized membrane protein (UPF0136 family)